MAKHEIRNSGLGGSTWKDTCTSGGRNWKGGFGRITHLAMIDIDPHHAWRRSIGKVWEETTATDPRSLCAQGGERKGTQKEDLIVTEPQGLCAESRELHGENWGNGYQNEQTREHEGKGPSNDTTLALRLLVCRRTKSNLQAPAQTVIMPT